MGKRYVGNDVLMTTAVLLRSGMMGNYHVPFWRAVEEATPSLTLIIQKKGMNMLGMERQNGTSGQEESASKEGKCGEKTPSTIDDAP
ncbi:MULTISPECIES: hypothetical protein [unclassified Microcoleus]|uniref:hypothetical protein n=1 Tax=unclassified Microcoleus TaxID=2642155 RepID=UPI002FD379F5